MSNNIVGWLIKASKLRVLMVKSVERWCRMIFSPLKFLSMVHVVSSFIPSILKLTQDFLQKKRETYLKKRPQ